MAGIQSGVELRGQPADPRLPTGEHVDTWHCEVEEPGPGANSSVVVELSSDDFDTYLGVVTGSGRRSTNDDASLSSGGLGSRVEWLGDRLSDADFDDEWVVSVTSYAPGEIGEYSFRIIGAESECDPD